MCVVCVANAREHRNADMNGTFVCIGTLASQRSVWTSIVLPLRVCLIGDTDRRLNCRLKSARHMSCERKFPRTRYDFDWTGASCTWPSTMWLFSTSSVQHRRRWVAFMLFYIAEMHHNQLKLGRINAHRWRRMRSYTLMSRSDIAFDIHYWLLHIIHITQCEIIND